MRKIQTHAPWITHRYISWKSKHCLVETSQEDLIFFANEINDINVSSTTIMDAPIVSINAVDGVMKLKSRKFLGDPNMK